MVPRFAQSFSHHAFENGRRMAMTIAEQLRQEGRKEGRDELILKQLKKRFGNLSPAIERKLNESGVDVLDRFGESIFDFESLEDAERWWEDFENSGNA
jgi:predicted transposase YdaD